MLTLEVLRKEKRTHNIVQDQAAPRRAVISVTICLISSANYLFYCKFGNFREDIIFAKLRICEVS